MKQCLFKPIAGPTIPVPLGQLYQFHVYIRHCEVEAWAAGCI